ncbi:MAG: PilZ domain-containing protein [Vicinamibacteria bacterium]|nr:PilZ domain-containing protein [Vicinamibacteria bacterium]
MKAADRFDIAGATCLLQGERWPVLNVSVGGLFVATPHCPMKGQFVDLELELPGREPFTVAGVVSWINDPAAPRAPELPQGFGLRIHRIALADKVALLDLLKRQTPPPARLK